MTASGNAIRMLADKYQALLSLRVARDEREAAGYDSFSDDVAEKRRAQMRRLAERFPGALKELETSTAERFRARLQELARATDDRDLWMRLMVDLHALLREVLAIKRFLSQEPDAGDAFLLWHQEFAHRSGILPVGDADALAAVRAPPDGRLVVLVWQLLEKKYGRPRRQLEQLLR